MTIHFDEARIAETAFQIWLNEGQPEGQSEAHWFRALDLIRAEDAPAPKKRAAKPKAPKAEKEAAPKKPRARKAAKA